MPELHDRLRAETADLHARLERLPYFRALHTGSLPKPAIVSFLRSLSIIQAVLERSLSTISSGPIAELSRHASPKVHLLVADLEALGAESIPSVTGAIQGALDYGAEILTTADDPLSLVGALYVLEGSQNGGIALKHDYAQCTGVPEDRLSYIGCYGTATAVRWSAFCGVLNALALTDDQANQVAQSAVLCFERLENICAALYPYGDKELKYHVAAVNFEAGNHAMPQNPLGIALALRAGRTAWDKYPYLERRFGERGRRFTNSDSCWLVALTEMSIESATRNLEWLRTVLASRGIPTVILEAHLGAISQALAVEFPEHLHLHARFGQFLLSREAERRALMDPECFSQLTDQFNQRFHSCTGLIIDSAANLITSAWVDERFGIVGALASVLDWFADPVRFSVDWIANVNELVTRLDRAAKPSC
jgi:heme oxygenase